MSDNKSGGLTKKFLKFLCHINHFVSSKKKKKKIALTKMKTDTPIQKKKKILVSYKNLQFVHMASCEWWSCGPINLIYSITHNLPYR